MSNCNIYFKPLEITIESRYNIITLADITADDVTRGDFMPESTERGALTEAVFYILLALHSPLHGYGIMQYIREISNGRVDLGPGTLYGAINTLLEKGWIEAVNSNTGGRKKEYLITQTGRGAVGEELRRLEELLENGNKIAKEVI